jgi:uncharacterized protein (TIGR03067 family)
MDRDTSMTTARIATRIFLSLALMSLFPAAANAGEKENLAELEKLAGTWQITSLESNGKAAPPQALEKFKTIDVVIKGESMTFMEAGKAVQELKIAVAADQTPKTIDIKRDKKGGKTNTALGIFRLEEKKLTLCTDDLGKQRPKEFLSKGEGISLLVFERK